VSTSGAPVLLYTRTECPHCAAMRSVLAARGAVVKEIDVGKQPELIPELLKLTRGRRIVPVVVERGRIDVAPDGGTAF
jgi:glutaredoxin 3